jgi:hypothetical protein
MLPKLPEHNWTVPKLVGRNWGLLDILAPWRNFEKELLDLYKMSCRGFRFSEM